MKGSHQRCSRDMHSPSVVAEEAQGREVMCVCVRVCVPLCTQRSYLSTTCCSCGATNIRKQAAIPTLRRNIVKTWASKVNPSKEEISDYIKLSKRLDAIQEIGRWVTSAQHTRT